MYTTGYFLSVIGFLILLCSLFVIIKILYTLFAKVFTFFYNEEEIIWDTHFNPYKLRLYLVFIVSLFFPFLYFNDFIGSKSLWGQINYLLIGSIYATSITWAVFKKIKEPTKKWSIVNSKINNDQIENLFELNSISSYRKDSDFEYFETDPISKKNRSTFTTNTFKNINYFFDNRRIRNKNSKIVKNYNQKSNKNISINVTKTGKKVESEMESLNRNEVEKKSDILNGEFDTVSKKTIVPKIVNIINKNIIPLLNNEQIKNIITDLENSYNLRFDREILSKILKGEKTEKKLLFYDNNEEIANFKKIDFLRILDNIVNYGISKHKCNKRSISWIEANFDTRNLATKKIITKDISDLKYESKKNLKED